MLLNRRPDIIKVHRFERFSANEQSRPGAWPSGSLLSGADTGAELGSCRRTPLIWGTALALALLMQSALADTVMMRNGDRLTGKVVRQEGSELLIRTAYAGTITLGLGAGSDVRLDAPTAVLFDDASGSFLRSADAGARNPCGWRCPADPKPMTVSTNEVRVIQPEPWEMGIAASSAAGSIGRGGCDRTRKAPSGSRCDPALSTSLEQVRKLWPTRARHDQRPADADNMDAEQQVHALFPETPGMAPRGCASRMIDSLTSGYARRWAGGSVMRSGQAASPS